MTAILANSSIIYLKLNYDVILNVIGGCVTTSIASPAITAK
jgi:hypothetical protein